jgi:hypothetical protein
MFKTLEQDFDMCLSLCKSALNPLCRLASMFTLHQGVGKHTPPVYDPSQAFRFSATCGISTYE